MYPQSEIKDLVALTDGKPVTTSRQVAKHFGKRHANILRLFQTRIIGCHSTGFIELNFEFNEYTDSMGRSLPELLMTKDGFIAIATKLRGAELWQERFIAAFNGMAEQIERMALNMWTRRMALETKDATSLTKASIGSGLMLTRKRELPAIKAERAILDSAIQPSLLN